MIRILVLIAALFAGAPLLAQDTQPSGAISVEQSVGSDVQIRARIRDILSELDGFGDVRVSVSNGIVTFTGEALDSAAIDSLDSLAARVEGVVAIQNQVEATTDVALRLNPVVENFGERLRSLVAVLPLLGVAVFLGLCVGGIGWLLARWERPYRRLAPNSFIANIYRTLIRMVFALGGVVVALDVMGATALLGTLLGAAGIVGLAVGFAVRDTVENFIASIMLSLRQPFRPNDFVEIEGDMGSVIRLTSRATVLLDPNGNHIRIPNATVFKSRIINYSRNAERRFEFTLGVAPGSDLQVVKEIGLKVMQDLPFILTAPAPLVFVDGAGDSTVAIKFFGWINQHDTSLLPARGECIRITMDALTQAGIAMPEPGFRLIAPGAASEPQPPASVAPLVEPVKADDVRPDETLEDLVQEERAELSGSDLLSERAPEE